jgi:glycosyltransferase involved in cell wall biosynthesis
LEKAICYISPRSVHSYRWIEAFDRKGYNMSLISDFQTWLAPRPDGIRVSTYIFPTLNKLNFCRRFVPNTLSVIRILKKINPDIVHVHTQHHYGPVVAISHIPFVLTSWGLEVLMLSRMNLFRKVLAKHVAMEATKITVDAECLKQIWVSMGVPQSKIDVIPFGVDIKRFDPSVDGQSVRKKLGIGKSDITIVSTRSFFPHYNVDCLIKAIPMILKKHPSVKFIIKGGGPLEGYLKDLSEKLNVSQSIRFVNPVPYTEIPNYIAAGDIYVSTSFIDSTSVSLLEAMACGLPPITTDISGNREWIENEVNGILFPAKDHTILADKISQLIENEDQRKRFGEKSRKIIEEKASWEKCVAKMEAIYQSLT